MTSIIISPQADTAEQLSRALQDLGGVRILRTFRRYPSESELARVVQATGPAIVFLSTDELHRAAELALAVDRTGTGAQVIAVDRTCDPELLVEMMRAGIREIVPLPLDPQRLEEAILRIAEVLERKPLALTATEAVFSFLPAKPGDGTSTVALNVSAAIARQSTGRTLIADFDLNLGMVSFLLKVTNGRSVLDAVGFADNLDDSVWDQLVVKRDDLDVLCSGRLDPGNVLDPAQAETVLHFARRTYKTICLDFSGNMERYSIELMRQSQEIFLVCTPDIPSLHFARTKAQFLRQAGLEDRVSVLLNRSERRSSFSTQEVEKLLGARVRFSFLNDPLRVGTAMDAGTYVRSNSELGRQFEAFAKCLTESGPVVSRTTPKRRFIEYFAIVPSSYHTLAEKRH